jgi:hypothetical protein
MRLVSPYAEADQAEPILASAILSKRRLFRWNDSSPTPRSSARRYSSGFGVGSILKIEDLDPAVGHYLGVLVYLGTATSFRLGDAIKPGDGKTALFLGRPMLAQEELYLDESTEIPPASFYSAIVVDRHPSNIWIDPFKGRPTRFSRSTPERKGEGFLEVVPAEKRPAHEMLNDTAKSPTAHVGLTYWVAISNTLKLMALILWSSIRHPLTESVIDFDNVRVIDNPVRDTD